MSQSKFAGIYVKLQFQFSGISAEDGTSVTCPSGFPPKNTYVRSAPWCSTIQYHTDVARTSTTKMGPAPKEVDGFLCTITGWYGSWIRVDSTYLTTYVFLH